MEACPASFTAETEAELWKHIELHGATAHQEEPDKWSSEDRQQIKKLNSRNVGRPRTLASPLRSRVWEFTAM
ncbi:DUF1059 domain-containing protein [Sinorhizobium fredii]